MVEKTSTNETNDWSRIRSVFEEVLQCPAENRRQYAKEICGADIFLLKEVQSLLDSHDDSPSFLEVPAVVQIYDGKDQLDQLRPRQRLLHYEIRELIGKGGMGEVYLARDTKLDRNVAIKLLRKDLVPQVRASDRLLREARAAALLEHPNICQIYEISEADGFGFIVMQYIVGTTLDDLLSGGGTDIDTALELGTQIAAGLAEAHSQGIIHRDIKPANIIISEKGQAKILDFGLAKFVEGESNADAASRMESTGGVMGTVPYMSPEQLSGRVVDARTDVFSFGSLLFELVGGVPAFGRERNEDTVSAILNEEPDWSLVSPVIRPVIERCLAKKRNDRYGSGGEVADALVAAQKRVLTSNRAGSRPATTVRNRVATDGSEVETISYPVTVTQGFRPERPEGGSDLDSRPRDDSNDASDHGRNPDEKFQTGVHDRFRDFRKILIGAVGAIALTAGMFGYYLYPISEVTDRGEHAPPATRLYWELSYSDKRKFVRSRVLQIQTLINDEQRGISDESLEGIAKEVDWFVKRRDSLSQEPFKDGLRTVYGRASQYVPLIAEEFDKARVPTAIGIYQALIESEYRDCLMRDTGPVGIFQFTKATGERYGLAANDRCRIDLSSKAAAAYNSELLANFGHGKSSWTLAILSFNQGVDLTLSEIAVLHGLGLEEIDYWVISENRKSLPNYNADSDHYLSRFFAAAIIGENPEMFGLVTPALSTLRTRAALRILNQNTLVTIPGGTFRMGRNDSPSGLEKPEHSESVDGFRMNKTEVTNAEFADFISATSYKPKNDERFLAHWVNGRPIDSDENTPVRFVNIDDVSAFVRWKSETEGIHYRLPTEQEWEYVARNGDKNNLYPWGDRFDARCAHIDQKNNGPVKVGTRTCPNIWGIQDLIGNVFEWTATRGTVYSGNPVESVPNGEEEFIIRGGGAYDKSIGPNAITSTFRFSAPSSRRSPGLGFRLVAFP